MNKIIKHTTLLFLLLSCGITHGQTGTLYNVPLPGRGQIVRYHPGSGRHIVYSESLSGDNMFSITDMTTLTKVKIGNGLAITDFEIIDDLVFFCGNNAVSGLLGWFDINSFFYAGGPAYIDQMLLVLGLQTLDNIAVYHDTAGTIHIAGYGLNSTVTNINYYRAFEAVGNPATGMQYRTLDLWSTGLCGDISDVVVTDNLVVYLQPDRKQACIPYIGIGITFQPFPKYDMFGTPPFYYHYFQLSYMTHKYDADGNSYVVPQNSDPYSYYPHEGINPKMVHSFGDNIAVCTYRYDLDDNAWSPPPPPCGNRLPAVTAYITHSKFDLSQLVPNTNNNILMTSFVTAKLPDTNIYSIDGFEFDPQTSRYLVLHRHKTAGGVAEHAMTTFNFPSGGTPTFVESSYQTAYNTATQWLPTGMCMDSYVYYMVAGYNLGNYTHMFWRNSVGAPGGVCDRIVQ